MRGIRSLLPFLTPETSPSQPSLFPLPQNAVDPSQICPTEKVKASHTHTPLFLYSTSPYTGAVGGDGPAASSVHTQAVIRGWGSEPSMADAALAWEPPRARVRYDGAASERTLSCCHGHGVAQPLGPPPGPPQHPSPPWPLAAEGRRAFAWRVFGLVSRQSRWTTSVPSIQPGMGFARRRGSLERGRAAQSRLPGAEGDGTAAARATDPAGLWWKCGSR